MSSGSWNPSSKMDAKFCQHVLIHMSHDMTAIHPKWNIVSFMEMYENKFYLEIGEKIISECANCRFRILKKEISMKKVQKSSVIKTC